MSDSNREFRISERGKLEADSAFIDALLEVAWQDDAEENEARISRLMSRLMDPDESEESVGDAAVEINDVRIRPNNWPRRAIAMAVAASVLIFAMIALRQNPSSAAASVKVRIAHCIEKLEQSGSKKYEILISNRESSLRKFELYVHKNKFVMRELSVEEAGIERDSRESGVDYGETVIGGDNKSYWIVSADGQSSSGSAAEIRSEVGEHFGRRIANNPGVFVLPELLRRLSNSYSLEFNSPESITAEWSGLPVECDVIAGTLARENRKGNLPSTAKILADADSGLVFKIVFQWDRLESSLRRTEMTMELSGFPELPKGFFDVTGHLGEALLDHPDH